MPIEPAPTMTIDWNRKYTAPENWNRNTPCTCECGDCDRWTIFIAPLTLLPGDNGACYSGNSLPVSMPLLGSITEPWCVSLRSIAAPVSVYVAERMFEGDIPGFIIDGVRYDYFTLADGGVACVCAQDGNWVVTGDAHGANEGN